MRVWVLATAGLLLAATASLGAEGFPLRAKYPSVTPISIEELTARYEQTLVVDVRSEIEFGVVHINNAVNIPVARGSFLTELGKLRPRDGAQPIAFYCNGHTCAKSYKAAEKAMEAGFKNVVCFDAGIYEWVNSQPERATLMGSSPAPRDRLISDQAFSARKIDFADFKKRASQPGAMVIDIREPFQRAQNPELPQNKLLALPDVRNIPTDRLVKLLELKMFRDKQLLITDAVGKQVRWLQYHLEQNGYANYAFLKKGVLGAAEAGGAR